MHSHLQVIMAASRLVASALALSSVMALGLAAGSGFLLTMLLEPQWRLSLLFAVLISASAAAIINAFTGTIRPNSTRLAGTAASGAVATLAGLEAVASTNQLPAMAYFAIRFFAELIFTYSFAVVLLTCLNLKGPWASRPPLAAAGALLVTGAVGFIGQSFIPLEKVSSSLPLVRSTSLVFMSIAVLTACGVYRTLRLDPKSIRASVRLRLPARSKHNAQAPVLKAAAAGLVIDVILALDGSVFGSTSGFSSLSTLPFCWVSVFLLCLLELSILVTEEKQGSATAKLAPPSAQRFLHRHLSEKQAWAATVGIKTANFTVDHDPGDILQLHLPASILQIRAEEIQRCIADVLGQTHLHSQINGHRIFGALDSELSVRPCIDTLKMFACLYLDAGPLVERRIKGLTELLPIVDPGLARLLQSQDVQSLIRRNLWFFQFDFGWIDQHVIQTPRTTRYDVRIDSVSSRFHQTMIDHIGRGGSVGNTIWVGPEARDRLIQEAPILKNTIEACPVTQPASSFHKSQDEFLMFTLKFEQLIPRLQRYFDLDSMRQTLLDFEPSAESAHLQNLINLQINKAKSPDEIMEVLGSITSMPWKGFREKDNALQLILSAYTNLNRLVTARSSGGSPDASTVQGFHAKILEAVRLVGYPSQILHSAQIHKIALRDGETLTTVASDPHHARFHEAWLLMATADYQKYTPEQRLHLIGFIETAARNKTLARHRLAQMKSVDALSSVGRVASPAEASAVCKALDHMALWFAREQVDPDICCLLLDTRLFLATQFRYPIDLPDTVVTQLDRYIQELQEDLGPKHPKVTALLGRWQEVRSYRHPDDALHGVA